MKFSIKVKTRAKQEKVEQTDKNKLIVSVKELPIEGRANGAMIDILANFFKVAKSKIKIVGGHKSKRKIIELIE